MTTVLHVISGLGIGGAEATLVQLACALQRRGITQHVVSLRNGPDNAAKLSAGGVSVTELGINSAAHGVFGLMKLRKLVGEVSPDVIQGWMYHGDLAAALAHRLSPKRAQRRLFWNLRASNLDDQRYRGIIRTGARFSNWPDLIIANSHAGAEFHRMRGYRSSRMQIIPNGIDVARFRPDEQARAEVRAELGIAPDARVAIHVARIDPMKDHAMFLRAMTMAPQVKGVMVGAGTETLQPPENVRVLGIRRDTARLYAAADMVVSTSAFAEGFSNVLAEGMSAGLVPIATDVGDARAIVGNAGQIIAPRDAQACASAIASESNLSPSERRARGLAARQRIADHFPVDAMIETYARLYTGRSAV